MRRGLPKAEAQVQSIAAQIWAEMLGMVCHPEYYKLGEKKVKYPFNPLITGLRRSLFRFPRIDLFSEYLYAIQTEGISALKSKFKDQLPLHHTMPCNLIDADAQLHFFKDFITVVLCLIGNAPIGYLRRDEEKIHRRLDEDENDVLRPPQEVLDAREEAEWREDFATDYALVKLYRQDIENLKYIFLGCIYNLLIYPSIHPDGIISMKFGVNGQWQ